MKSVTNEVACLSCEGLSGGKRISPGVTIYDGAYWVVEHAYPTALLGWLVIVLKRHAEALHSLTVQEYTELAQILYTATRLMRAVLHIDCCQKEYIAAFGEAPGFSHLHLHVIPRPDDLPDEFKAGKIFALLKPTPNDALSEGMVSNFCNEMAALFTFESWLIGGMNE